MLYEMVSVVFIVSMPCRLQNLGCLQAPGFELGSTWSPFWRSSGSACPAESGVEVLGFLVHRRRIVDAVHAWLLVNVRQHGLLHVSACLLLST